MRMLFRTFSGYEDFSVITLDDYINLCNRHWRLAHAPRELGIEVVYSETEKLNSRCLLGADHYGECNLSEEPDWRKLFVDAAKFASEYFEIGCVTLNDMSDENCRPEILTESAYLNAYKNCLGYNSFYILFNARPIRVCRDNIITIGRDRYSLERDQGSAIVWNLDKYADLDLSDYTLWGIEHNTKSSASCTDDVMVGLRDGKKFYAIR